MRMRSISPIIASFIALRVSGRLRVSVTMLSCRWYRTGPFVIRELLVWNARLGRPGPSPATACGALRLERAPRPAGPQPRDGLQRAQHLVRVHDRAQHDPALVRPVVAGAAVHRRALVPDQDVADPPAVVVDEALLGRVSSELIDQRPRLLPLHADETVRVHGIHEQDRPSAHRMPRDRGPLHLLVLLVGHALVVAVQALPGGPGRATVQAGEAGQQLLASLGQ